MTDRFYCFTRKLIDSNYFLKALGTATTMPTVSKEPKSIARDDGTGTTEKDPEKLEAPDGPFSTAASNVWPAI